MDKIKVIFLSLFLGLSFLVRGQQIGNYINNGSFEVYTDCITPFYLSKIKYWNSLNSSCPGGAPLSTCNNAVPNQFNTIYQYPKTGKTMLGSTFFWMPEYRGYIKNWLKDELVNGQTYCVKFYINIMNSSTYGCDRFGIYFGDVTTDTITHCNIPLSYLAPHIESPAGNLITDTLGWTAVTGTFVAFGNERYAVIGIFKPDSLIDTVLINPAVLPLIFTDICIDDVSCIPVNLNAYAGPDKSCIPGDSVFIGRQPDFAIDSGCVWYKLPNMTTAIDTISGLWVKPTTTSTYVVRQQLDCSPLKWDTVVVFQDAVGFKDIQWYSNNINLFPNPTADNLSISFSSSGSTDIRKISIINSLGQTIREEDVEIKSNSFTLQTSDLDNGIYQVHFKTKTGTVTKQFVKN